jgi:hypothetical protein
MADIMNIWQNLCWGPLYQSMTVKVELYSFMTKEDVTEKHCK